MRLVSGQRALRARRRVGPMPPKCVRRRTGSVRGVALTRRHAGRNRPGARPRRRRRRLRPPERHSHRRPRRHALHSAALHSPDGQDLVPQMLGWRRRASWGGDGGAGGVRRVCGAAGQPGPGRDTARRRPGPGRPSLTPGTVRAADAPYRGLRARPFHRLRVARGLERFPSPGGDRRPDSAAARPSGFCGAGGEGRADEWHWQQRGQRDGG